MEDSVRKFLEDVIVRSEQADLRAQAFFLLKSHLRTQKAEEGRIEIAGQVVELAAGSYSELKRLYQEQGLIPAVKYLRNTTGCRLCEARDAIERWSGSWVASHEA